MDTDKIMESLNESINGEVEKALANSELNDLLCGIEQAKTDYNDDMDRIEKTYNLTIKPISESKRERLINRSCGD